MRDNINGRLHNILRAEYETGKHSGVCELLGVGSGYWTDCLVRIAMASVMCAPMLHGVPDCAGEELYGDSGDSLVHRGTTLPSVSKCTIEPKTWPCSAEARVTVSDGSVMIEALGCTYSPRCVAEDGLVAVEWPEGMGISGALNLSDGDSAVLPLLPSYPVEFVISLAKADERVYNLLRDTEYSSAFFTEMDPREQLAILVLALYKSHLSDNVKAG